MTKLALRLQKRCIDATHSVETPYELAAIAIEFGATMVSIDQDFARFSGLKLKIPK